MEGEGRAGREGGASDLKQRTRENIQDAAHTARERIAREAESGAERAKQRAARPIDRASAALHESAERLEEEDSGFAPYLRGAAEQLSRFAEQMRRKSVREVLDDLEDIARENPLVFFAGSVVVGFGASKVLRTAFTERPAEERSR